MIAAVDLAPDRLAAAHDLLEAWSAAVVDAHNPATRSTFLAALRTYQAERGHLSALELVTAAGEDVDTLDPSATWCDEHRRYHQRRERAVPCRVCRTSTVHPHGVCPAHEVRS